MTQIRVAPFAIDTLHVSYCGILQAV